MGVMTLGAFAIGCGLVVLAAAVVAGRNRRVDERMQDLAGARRSPAAAAARVTIGQKMLPRLGSALVPTDEVGRNRLTARILHAGLYRPHALAVFLGAKALLTGVLAIAGIVVGISQHYPFLSWLALGMVGGGVGMLAPNFWLDSRKAQRQSLLRRGLPDALDMVVICLKGGLSLQGSLQRVVAELWLVHPMLAAELSIALREVQLGRTVGEAMRRFADRCDLEEIRGLASVLLQAERLGASTVNALRVHADTLRLKRLQRAEESAGKAATKMVFPTILCIFPAILLVVIGPAAIKVVSLFAAMSR